MATKRKTPPKRKSVHQLVPKDGIHLEGKVVKLRDNYFRPGINADEMLFKCSCGFGCNPVAIGSAVFGEFVSGEHRRIERGEIEGIVQGFSFEAEKKKRLAAQQIRRNGLTQTLWLKIVKPGKGGGEGFAKFVDLLLDHGVSEEMLGRIAGVIDEE